VPYIEPLTDERIRSAVEWVEHQRKKFETTPEAARPTLGYGLTSEISPELAEIMEKNSKSLDEMETTKKAASLDSALPTED
jgi:hypothetical protein